MHSASRRVSLRGRSGRVAISSAPPCPKPTSVSRATRASSSRSALNLQPGQTLGDQRPRRARAARPRDRARGVRGRSARYVDVLYTDQHVRRAHIELAAEDDCSATRRRGSSSGCASSASSGGALLRDHRRTRSRSSSPTSTARASARRACASSPRQSLQADRRPLQLDDRRLSRTRAGRRRCSASPTSSGSGRRSRQRCGSTSPIPSPPGASTSRGSQQRAAALNERRFDQLRYRGPGTDLTIGLHPDVRLAGGARRRPRASSTSRTCRPKRCSRLPTPAASTAPSARRYPLQIQGNIVRGLEVRFDGGPRGRGARRRRAKT